MAHGVLVLADISGYTRYVGGTEVEHAQQAIAQLLDVLVSRLAPPLQLSAVEGDALFLYRESMPPDLARTLDVAYRDFRAAAAGITPCTECECTTCGAIKDMELKYVVHAGDYTTQRVAGRVQLFGHDVNLAHRLLKNTIPAHQYLFATESALRDLPLEGTPHVEKTDLGEVRGRYRRLD